jgi:hypothetical protein
MARIMLIAIAAMLTGTAANAQTDKTVNSNAQIQEKDTTLMRSRWDNPTTSDPNSMKTAPGVEMQMDNGTRREQREFKNTVDTPGAKKKLPRRDPYTKQQ